MPNLRNRIAGRGCLLHQVRRDFASVSPTAAPVAADRPTAPIQPVPSAVVSPAGWPLPPDPASLGAPRHSVSTEKSSAMTILAVVGGGLVVLFVILIVAAIAIPNLLRSKMAANQAAAVGSLRTLNTACVSYADTYGGFPPSLSALGGQDNGGAPSATAAQLIDNVLQSGRKSGYLFFYSAADPDDKGVISSYAVNADPVVAGSTGARHFFTDQSGVIRAETSGPANQNSPPID